MSVETRIALIALIAAEFDRRHWRDAGDAGQTFAQSLARGESPRQAAARVSGRFLAENGISRADVEQALNGIQPPASQSPVHIRGVPNSLDLRPGPPTLSQSKAPSPRLLFRSILAVLILVGGFLLIFQAPTSVDWRWMLDHPNRLGIELLAMFAAAAVATGALVWRWQPAALAAIPAIIALLQMVGR